MVTKKMKERKEIKRKKICFFKCFIVIYYVEKEREGEGFTLGIRRRKWVDRARIGRRRIRGEDGAKPGFTYKILNKQKK